MKPLVFVYDKFYVPKKLVKNSAYEKFTHQMFEDSICAKCPYLSERPAFQCEGCGANYGEIRTYRKRMYQGVEYIGLPLGQKNIFLTYLKIDDYDEVEIIDRRFTTKFDYNIIFGGRLNGALREHQLPVAEAFLKKKYGIIEAPPRFGKTLLSVYIGVKLGYKMLVLASQNEFLNQFIDHVKDFTNLPELEKKHNKKLFGVAKKEQDFYDYQITASTYQRFMSDNGKRLLKSIAPHYGTVWIDEIHKANATCFSKVVSALPARVKFGSTGTPERKDGKEKIMRDIIGPVVAQSAVESMIPTVSVIWTGYKPRSEYKQWTYAMKWLANNEERNQLIIDHALMDIERGHSIIIPCVFRNHIAELTRRINAEYGSRVADYFVGGGDKKNLKRRDDVLDDAKSGKIRVVVGTRSILQLGLNVPRWSCVTGDTYIPTSNGLIRMDKLFPGDAKEYDYTLHNGKIAAPIKFGGRRLYAQTRIIKTIYGNTIEASKNHQFLVLTDDFRLKFKKVESLKEGDYIVTKSSGNMVDSEYRIEEYSFDPQRFFGIFKWEDYDGKIQCPYCKERSANLKTHLTAYHKTEDCPDIVWTNYQRYLRFKKLNTKIPNIPETVDSKLGYIIGFLLSDGAIRSKSVEFYNTDLKLINRIKEYMTEVFNVYAIEVEKNRDGRKLIYELRYPILELVDFFNFLGIKGKSFEKTVPDCIMQSPKHVIDAFLCAYLDADGCAHSRKMEGTEDRFTNVLFFSSSSKRMLEQMQLLIFHSFGVHGNLDYKKSNLEVMGRVNNGFGYIGYLKYINGTANTLADQLTMSYKTHKLKKSGTRTYIPYADVAIQKIASKRSSKYYKDYDGNNIKGLVLNKYRTRWGRTVESVLNDTDTLNLLKKIAPKVARTLQSIVFGKLIPVKISSIEDNTIKKSVYDVSMADENNPYYLSDAFISHNCIYEIFPISNKPNLKQETSRVRTPMDNKKTPEVKFFVDNMKQSLYCFKSSIHHCQQFGYKFDGSVYESVAQASRILGFKNWLNEGNKPTIKSNGSVEKKGGKLF